LLRQLIHPLEINCHLLYKTIRIQFHFGDKNIKSL
jgi:hypothetical protein